MDNEEDSLKLLTLHLDDVIVYREWQNIDILIKSEKEKFLICIENKVDTQDSNNQLNRYFDIISSRYSDEYLKIFLYLTPDGLAPLGDDNDVWKCISYKAIIDIIEKQNEKCSVNREVKWFVESYLTILRREIMGDEKLIELCQEIYKKHKVALDLIYEHRPDRLQNVAEIFMAWCRRQDDEGKIIFREKNSSKSYCRFRTEKMDNLILPTETISGWGTENHYFYELSSYLDKYGNVKFCIQLSFSSHNLEAENIRQLEEIDRICCNGVLKSNWQWRIVFKSKMETIEYDKDLPEGTGEDNYIFKKLDKLLDEVLNKEVGLLAAMNPAVENK